MDRRNLKIRPESFGGIVSLEEPPALVYVDQEYMHELGVRDSPLWDRPANYLSAPTEVHLSVTNACPLRCRHCYTDSGGASPDEMDGASLKRTIDLLADMDVFHIAFGGGEAFGRADFLSLARYARQKGIVPNVTTNGHFMTPELAEQCRVFGQINVSIDGVGSAYREVRGVDGFAAADRALSLLLGAGCKVGINCVISRPNFDHLPDLVRYAALKGIGDILFLRVKPTGRGRDTYESMRLTAEQHRRLFPYLSELTGKHGVMLRMDCSFVPAVCWHGPDREAMEFFDVRGCVAGDTLAGVTCAGGLQACSFSHDTLGDVWQMKQVWHESHVLRAFRQWPQSAPEPCASCEYLALCRGGCHIVAEAVTGDFHAPDPGCPRVAG